MPDPREDLVRRIERRRGAMVASALMNAASPRIGRFSVWGCVVCALVASALWLGSLYGSGTPALALDVTRELEGVRGRSSSGRVGPFRLAPDMNAMRFVLNASHSPLGRARRRFALALEDAKGTVLWRADGLLAGRNVGAKIVITRTQLEPFTVRQAGEYFVRVRGSGASMDDLRAATLQLRRGVTRIDPALPWAFGVAALACLLAGIVSALRRPSAKEAAEPEQLAA